MIIEACIAVGTFALASIAVYLILTLKKGMVSLEETNRTLSEVRTAVHDLSHEAQHLIHTANQIASSRCWKPLMMWVRCCTM
jgi:uncharacterized protein YoxC